MSQKDLDPSKFTSLAEFRRVKSQLDKLSEEKANKIIEKHGYGKEEEDNEKS